MVKMPVVTKKKLSSYIMGEQGKISKQSLLTAGALLGTAAIGASILSQSAQAGSCCSDGSIDGTSHGNKLDFDYTASSNTAKAIHSHHASHSSY